MNALKMFCAALCVICSQCLTQAAHAKSETAVSTWIVEPPQITSEPITLTKGDFLQRARLLPIGLIELTADAHVGPNVDDVIRAGEQLFELAGGTMYRPSRSSAGVFCQVRTFDTESKGLIGKTIVSYRHCLVDRERDGQIDDAVLAFSCPYDIPIVGVKVPSGPPTLAGPTYRRLSIKEFRDGPMVGIAFGGIALLDGDPRFIRAFGSGNPIPLFGEKHSRSGDDPGQRTSFGAAFTILRVEEQTVTIRNDRPIPVQPFGIIRTGPCKR
ncbi:hypothetical protein [Sphingomonas sanxanigenens]|uniref:hypothetical protein n=1 Tax=Sphingomonas sanxanigenens TaxID=397260 RepID=UPI0013018AD5|nr:hypothetical protein [Sphingomonas sanxanigenens]